MFVLSGLIEEYPYLVVLIHTDPEIGILYVFSFTHSEIGHAERLFISKFPLGLILIDWFCL